MFNKTEKYAKERQELLKNFDLDKPQSEVSGGDCCGGNVRWCAPCPPGESWCGDWPNFMFCIPDMYNPTPCHC